MPNDPVQSIITRQIYLNRYSNNVANRILAILNNAYLDAVNQLRAIDLGQSTTSANSYHAQRLRAFMLQTRQAIATATIQAEGILVPSLQGAAEAQTEFIQRQLALAIEGGVIDGRTIGKTLSADTIPSSVVVNTVEVPPNFARAIATSDPNDIPLILQRDKAQSLANAVADAPVTLNLRTPLGTELARTMDNVPILKRFRAITEGSADLFDRQVRIGLMQGETTDQIARRLVGKVQYSESRTFLGKGAAIEAKNVQVKTLVRTSVQSVTNAANQAVYQANQHVTKKYRYLATLDSRTTAFCRANDRRIFEYGKGPVPPIHWNCRSVSTPVLDLEGLGIPPPPAGSRASMDGRVAGDLDYSEWLKQQPTDRVERILGKGKAKLFLEDKITLSDMVRSDGREVTLAELRRLTD
jgi:SPP1 gp7 family putative phage head morphogenesis protein